MGDFRLQISDDDWRRGAAHETHQPHERSGGSCRVSCGWRVSWAKKSVQFNAVVGVPGGHVGKDPPVARLEALDDLDRVDRAAAELHLRARSVNAVGVELEDSHRALLLAEGGA